jgi:hypothetical protein
VEAKEIRAGIATEPDDAFVVGGQQCGTALVGLFIHGDTLEEDGFAIQNEAAVADPEAADAEAALPFAHKAIVRSELHRDVVCDGSFWRPWRGVLAQRGAETNDAGAAGCQFQRAGFRWLGNRRAFQRDRDTRGLVAVVC